MPKKITKILKLNLPAGSATPAPPVGPILGQAGINMMDFLKQYNARTEKQRGQIIPAQITIYQDRSFSFELKLPPVSDLIKQELKLKAGSKTTKHDSVGQLTTEQIDKIASQKLPDLNTKDLAAAAKIITGTAKSMGVDIKS